MGNSRASFSPPEELYEPGPLPTESLAKEGWEIAKGYTPKGDPGDRIPKPPKEWAGRRKLLKAISEDYCNREYLITGLIGFGGEGKSSLVRRWVHGCLYEDKDYIKPEGVSELPRPKGLFYWDFYEDPNVDNFFQSALIYFGAEKYLDKIPSSHQRASFLAGMMAGDRYLVILDGFEVVQHQDLDNHGLLQSPDLQEFLCYFASANIESFCIIASRTPVHDLIDYVTYIHREVTPLETVDSRDLLRYFGVNGEDEEIDRVVEEWGRHALTLSLIGAFLREIHDGQLSKLDIKSLDDFQPPENNADPVFESYFKRVRQVLRRYDRYLTEQEREFLMEFCTFRLPVSQHALDSFFDADPGIIKRLMHYRILRESPHDMSYTAHPLVKRYYLTQLEDDPSKAKSIHIRAKDYYLAAAAAEESSRNGTGRCPPKLQEIFPLIEVVYHLCQAQMYSEAHEIRNRLIDQERDFVLTLQLGAYDTRLKLLLEFFPNRDTSKSPYGSRRDKYDTLKDTGFCLMALGDLFESRSLFEKSVEVAIQMKDPNKLSDAYRDLASLSVYLGKLKEGEEFADKAIHIGNKEGEKFVDKAIHIGSNDGGIDFSQMLNSYAIQAWVSHLTGQLKVADDLFNKTWNQQLKKEKFQPCLYGSRGIFHADYLQRVDKLEEAKFIAEANLRISQNNFWKERESRCRRILGDIEYKLRHFDSAQSHYDHGLKIVRETSQRSALIENLTARGVFLSETKETERLDEAYNNLTEALRYSVAGSYRIYEVNIRIGLAHVHLGRNNLSKAREEAEFARRLSDSMGYYWGKVDADSFLARLSGAGNSD